MHLLRYCGDLDLLLLCGDRDGDLDLDLDLDPYLGGERRRRPGDDDAVDDLFCLSYSLKCSSSCLAGPT